MLAPSDAVRRMLWQPGELGAAQAYVTGELDVPGDLDDALTHAFAVAKERGLGAARGASAASLDGRRDGSSPAVRTAARIGALGRPPAAPASQARIRGRLHSQLRDRQRDQLPLRPVQRVLRADPRPADGLLVRLPRHARRLGRAGAVRQAVAGLPQARARAGHDAARRRLRLGIAVAARRRALRRAGHRHHHRRPSRSGSSTPGSPSAASSDRVDDPALRLPRRRPDAVRRGGARSRWASTSARATTRRTPRCCTRSVKPGGRVLVQQMSRRRDSWPGGGPFIESFIAPDMHMRPVGETVAYLERAGLEVRDVHALREHYVLDRRRLARELPRATGDRLVEPGRRGGRPGLAALPGRRRDGVPRRPDGRRPDPHGPPRR